jgi:hypothetical protein
MNLYSLTPDLILTANPCSYFADKRLSSVTLFSHIESMSMQGLSKARLQFKKFS